MSKTTTAATPSGSDSDMLLLKSNLKQLRLPTIGREFEKLAREASSSNQTFEQYLLRLTELEVTARQSNALQARIKQANLPVEKDLDSFDFSAIPSLNKQKILELARGEWITNHSNVCLLGQPGTPQSSADEQSCVQRLGADLPGRTYDGGLAGSADASL